MPTQKDSTKRRRSLGCFPLPPSKQGIDTSRTSSSRTPGDPGPPIDRKLPEVRPRPPRLSLQPIAPAHAIQEERLSVRARNLAVSDRAIDLPAFRLNDDAPREFRSTDDATCEFRLSDDPPCERLTPEIILQKYTLPLSELRRGYQSESAITDASRSSNSTHCVSARPARCAPATSMRQLKRNGPKCSSSMTFGRFSDHHYVNLNFIKRSATIQKFGHASLNDVDYRSADSLQSTGNQSMRDVSNSTESFGSRPEPRKSVTSQASPAPGNDVTESRSRERKKNSVAKRIRSLGKRVRDFFLGS